MATDNKGRALLSASDSQKVSCEFDQCQKLPLFPQARNFNLIAQYRLVPGSDLSVINIDKNCLIHNQTKYNFYSQLDTNKL